MMPKRVVRCFLAAAAVAALHGRAHAALTVTLGLPGVTGETNAPGRPGVTQLDSLTLQAGQLDATKPVDSTSPALAAAEVGGTPYATATLSFYDAIASDSQPDAELVLHTALVSGIQSVLLGGNPGEVVSFVFASPSLSLFLELPGVTGESSAPGHPGVIALDSLTLSANGFSVRKSVDSTSPALQTALALAHPYATATLLVYSNVLSQSQPDFELVYQSALVASIAPAPSQSVLKEDVAFATAGMHVVPEPGAPLVLLTLAGAAAARRSSRSAARAAAGRTRPGARG